MHSFIEPLPDGYEGRNQQAENRIMFGNQDLSCTLTKEGREGKGRKGKGRVGEGRGGEGRGGLLQPLLFLSFLCGVG